MGKKSSKQLYKAFLDNYDAANRSIKAGNDPMVTLEAIANTHFAAGEYVGYNEGLWAGVKGLIKGAVVGAVSGVIIGKVVDHFVFKAIEEEDGPVQYGPFIFSKKED